MRFRQIEVFHAVYTTGSISAAARALHVSQPSVSKVLHHTQHQLGLTLFTLVRGRLVATDEAHALFVEVSEITLDRKIRRIFTGWMFAESPGLNAVEHPVYDVWLTECKMQSDVPPPQTTSAQ